MKQEDFGGRDEFLRRIEQEISGGGHCILHDRIYKLL